jgi:diguanylate cyclase (GGDEF)-like protein
VHVLYLDIDDFKTINDSRGHTEGDAVLAALAHRLQDTLRSSHSVGGASHDIVARLAGDEFAIVLEDCLVPGAVAGRIQTLLHTPLQVDDHEVFISVSIGSMVFDGSAADPAPEAVLAAANVAMHEAKRAGKSRHLVFEPRMQDEAQQRHALGEELRYALERSEFTLAYQPVVDLGTGAVIGAEALVRWQHPVRGTVAPDEFISRAEETGLIVGMGTWVLEEACRQTVSWRRGGAVDFTIAVNVSGRQLREPDFVTVVRAALSRTGLHPTALCLEMTESILMERDDAAIAMLTELRGDGVHLAIDDFGTGYSSLGALRRLPVDLLKIDRSFISSLPEDDDAGTIAWAVVRLGHTLGLPVLAEGIETEEQRAAVQRFGCDQAQGYLFGRPMPAEQFTAVVLPAPA